MVTTLMTEYLTAEKVAETLGVHVRTVVRWIKRGDFPGAIKLNPNLKNSPYRVPKEGLEWYMENRQIKKN